MFRQDLPSRQAPCGAAKRFVLWARSSPSCPPWPSHRGALPRPFPCRRRQPCPTSRHGVHSRVLRSSGSFPPLSGFPLRPSRSLYRYIRRWDVERKENVSWGNAALRTSLFVCVTIVIRYLNPLPPRFLGHERTQESDCGIVCELRGGFLEETWCRKVYRVQLGYIDSF